MEICRELSYATVRICTERVGQDICVRISGGDRPHIGCTVLAQPRPSLRNNGETSATASVLNVIGHKDETICRYVAEMLAGQLNVIVVCTGGFHVDDIRPEQIRELQESLRDMTEELVEILRQETEH